ncbi:TraR/DksA C4-type zinc finger protein [Yimella sp. cx-573]|nr:TraR/DksA C4-type zinc finger protein [Yimella sp. cx-573]
MAAKSAATKRAAVNKSSDASVSLAVRDDESPWTAEELALVRDELSADVERLEGELKSIESDIAGLITDSSSGAGDDQADLGTKAYDRESEYNLAQNSRRALEQAQRALARIDDGTYGICENCGQAIGKERLQAFPRATLCMQCKQQQEKRH